MDNLDKIKEIVSHRLFDIGVMSDGGIDVNERFSDMGADSLDEVELIMDFEEAFGISVRDIDAEKITTIREAEDYLIWAGIS